jgi:hypothetical protein
MVVSLIASLGDVCFLRGKRSRLKKQKSKPAGKKITGAAIG